MHKRLALHCASVSSIKLGQADRYAADIINSQTGSSGAFLQDIALPKLKNPEILL